MKNDQEILNFCHNIRHLRKSHGLSKAKMAHILGIGTKSLTRIECNELPPHTSCIILYNIHKYFHIPPHKLFESLE